MIFKRDESFVYIVKKKIIPLANSLRKRHPKIEKFAVKNQHLQIRATTDEWTFYFRIEKLKLLFFYIYIFFVDEFRFAEEFKRVKSFSHLEGLREGKRIQRGTVLSCAMNWNEVDPIRITAGDDDCLNFLFNFLFVWKKFYIVRLFRQFKKK